MTNLDRRLRSRGRFISFLGVYKSYFCFGVSYILVSKI